MAERAYSGTLPIPRTLPFNDTYIASVNIKSHFQRIDFHIRGELNVTVAATLLEDGIVNLVKNIVFKPQGGDRPVDVDGETLLKRASMIVGQPMIIDQPAVGVAVNAFYMVIPVFFSLPETDLPLQAMWNTFFNTPVSLEIRVGTVSDVISAGTATLQNGTIDAYTEQITGLDANILPRLNKLYNILVGEDVAVSSDRTLAKELNPDGQYKAFIFKTETAAGVNKDDRLGKIWIKAKNDETGEVITIAETSFDQLKNSNIQDYNLLQLKYMSGPAFNYTGFAIFDLSKPGPLDEPSMLDSVRYSNIEIHAEVLNAGKVWLTVQELK